MLGCFRKASFATVCQLLAKFCVNCFYRAKEEDRDGGDKKIVGETTKKKESLYLVLYLCLFALITIQVCILAVLLVPRQLMPPTH